MLTKNAIGNMINRYTAVLKKCHLLNTLGTLAFVTAVGVAGVGEAFATDMSDMYTIGGVETGKDYYTTYFTTYTIDENGNLVGNDEQGVTLKALESGHTLVKVDGTALTSFFTFTDAKGDTYYLKDGSNNDVTGTINGINNTYFGNSNYNTGGACQTTAKGTISGDFIGNHADDLAGAVYNANMTSGASISGNFFGNIVSEDHSGELKGNGGAIANGSSKVDATAASINSISGNFIGNYSVQAGGAIVNFGTVTTIENSIFICNASVGAGGAISNFKTIGTIGGDFIGNTSVNSGTGGAIINVGTIGTDTDGITGNFYGNSANLQGGAVWNNNSITSIAGYFAGNYTGTIDANGVITISDDSKGGAIYNRNSITSIGDANTTFTGNQSESGGAIYNTIFQHDTNKNLNIYGTIGTITADFTSNKATESGGAIFNDSNGGTGADNYGISTITGNFTSNMAGTSGGAVYNTGKIETISGDFSENTANSEGGAIYNTGTITTISGDFKNNTASTNGGAIYTKSDIGFLANNENHEFTNNVAGTDYNAIYVDGSDVDLTFTMQGTGDFTMNDGITGSATTTSYDVAIAGADNTKNVFKLNDTISDAGKVTISKAKLVLGTHNHTGAKDAAGTTLADLTTVGDLYFRDTLMGDNAVLEIAVGTTKDGNNETINRVVTAGTDEVLDVGADDKFIITSGTFDIVDGTLKVESGAQQFSTADGSVLKANIADFGYSGGSESKILTLNNSNDLVKTELTNNGSLVLVYDGLSINKTAYEYLKQYVDSATTDGLGWTEILAARNGSYSVDFGTPTLSGYYSLTTHVDENTSDTGINLDEFVMAGDLATNEELSAVGIVKNTIEADNESLTSTTYADATVDDISSTIASGATLTLTGASFMVGGTDTNADHVLLDEGTLTNSGTLNLGDASDTYASNFNGALTGTGTGSTTKVLSDTNFAKKTDMKLGATLDIQDDTSMAGLNVDGDSFLELTKGTLTLKAADVSGTTLDPTTTASTTPSSDINAYATELIADAFVSDSDIDGKLTMASGTTFKTESGVTNIVGATLDVADDENTKLTVTGGTLVTAFSDFVKVTGDAGVTYTPKKDAGGNNIAVQAAKSLAMTDLKDQLSITADDATVILDGQADYINKESFATFLNDDAWIGDSGFVKKSTSSNGSFALDYGAENGKTGAEFTDEGSATLDNTYTFDTAQGTITITNLNLTDYYSLSQFLRHGILDTTTGTTTYTFAEPVISGDLGAKINFTAPTLLQGNGQNSTIASSSTLTLTGAGYKENGDTVNAGVLVTGGTLTNNGTLNLGASGNTADLTFTGKLTTNSTGTTTVNGPISITGAVTSAGKTTFSGEAELKDTLTVGTTGEVEFTATDKTATIADAVESAGSLTFKGTAELKDTLNVTGDTTSFEGMTTIGTANTATGAVTVEDGGEVVFGNDVNDTTTIYGAVESDGKTTFSGTAELKDTLNVTGDTTTFEGTTTIGMANTATGAVTVEDGGEVVFGNDVNDTTTIYGAVESDGKTTFSGTAELKDTLNVTGDTTTFEGTTTIDGVTTVSDGTLKIGSATTTPTVNPTVTMSGIDVTEKGKLNVESGKVILTANADIDGTLLMTDGTGMEAQGVDLAIKKGPDTNAYFFATDNVNDEKSTITIESFSNDTDGNALVNFSAYADNGSSLIFGAVPTTGDSKVQYDYIMDTVTDAADKELLYVGLDRPLKMANGTNLVLGSNPTTTPTGSYFGANSLVIADMAGIDKTEAVISGSGTLEVHKDSSLGLVNANEGEYIIVDGFSSSTVYDTNNAGTDVPWDEDSVTIGNCLLVVDSVTGIGTTANPYKVKVRQDVPEELYEADGGDLLKDVVDSGNFSADSTDPLGKLLYDAAEKGEDSLAKAQAGAATGGASSGANASGMAAARAATATFDIRNTIVNVGSLTDAGGTLLVKDASGKVTAEYTNVIEVADGVSISDAPAALGGTGSDLGNSIGLWAMPFYTHESISGARMGSHTNNTKTDLYGVTLGADKTFTPAGIDVLRLGLAFNVGTGETDGSGYVGTSKNDFEFFGLAAYGSMRKGSATVSGSISYTNSDGEFSTETCTGETNTDVWYAALNAENAFNIGTIDGSAFFTDFNIIPYIGIGYMTSKTDDYKTSLARTVEIDRQNVITLPLGLKFNKEFHLDSGWILKPQFSMGAIFADGDLDQRSVTGGASINTQVTDDITYDLDLSIDIRKGHFGFFFDYDVQKSDIRTAHGVSVKAEYRF